MSVTLTEQDEHTLRTAAYGAVTLLATAGATTRPHKIATAGTIALASTTGKVGHVLAKNPNANDLNGKSTAEIADQVLSALTTAMALLKKQVPAEADNFRRAVLVAVVAAQSHEDQPSPALAEITRKITESLDAA